MWTGTPQECWEATPGQSPEVVENTNDIGQTGRLNSFTEIVFSEFLGRKPHSLKV